MATNELFNRYFQEAAKRIAQGRAAAGSQDIDLTSKYPSVLGRTPQTPIGGERESDWSLGQGFIDLLSSGSYFTAGAARTGAEGIAALQKGDVLGGVARLNPFGLAFGGGQGIAERRTWSENLQDLGVSESDSAGWGLALDIALDPLWLVPGGAIASGIKGTTRGAVTAAGASRAGVQFSKEAFEAASKRLKELRPAPATTKETVEKLSPLRQVTSEPIADLFPATGRKISSLSGTGIKNLYQGIRQGNIENYAEWVALRRVDKANKAIRKATKKGTTAPLEKYQQKFGIDPFTLLVSGSKIVDDVIQDVTRVGEKPTFDPEVPNTPAEVAETVEKAVEAQSTARVVDNLEKDASAVTDAIDNALDVAGANVAKSVNAQAREVLGPARAGYMASRGLGTPGVDTATLAKVKASPLANDIAQAYDKLVSDPTNPEVIAAYSKLSEEVEDQFRYMTDELGINVKFVDEDPYQVMGKNGKMVTDSQLFMKDILENKQLLVYKTAEDQVHPLLSKDINDKFRAVHDFFGHAASGRGVLADGEEAAWISHSLMFSPLARRAMTTETRGQNSWVNAYGKDENGEIVKFAEQKAGLLPDAYVLLPSEYAAVENQIAATNSLIGRTAAVLVSKADIILDDLGMVAQPMRGFQYNEKEFAEIRSAVEKLTEPEFVKPGSPEHSLVIDALGAIKRRISGGTRLDGISEDLIDLSQRLEGTSAAALQKVLNTPTDATELLLAAAKAEGRTLDLPQAFKPISWAPKAGYSKPDFSIEDIQKYFPEDPILGDPKTLDIAMGVAAPSKVRALKGETKEQALARRQSQIWENFRARNENLIKDAEVAQKAEWDAVNNIPDSQLFGENKNGLFGLGPLPAGIPATAIMSMRGRPMTTMAKMLEGISAAIIREPIRMTRGTGGLESMIMADIKRRPNVAPRDEVLSKLFAEDDILSFTSSKMTGAKFKFVDSSGTEVQGLITRILAGEGIPAGVKLVAENDIAKQLFTRLNELAKTRPEIQITRMRPEIKAWITKKLDDATSALQSRRIRISRSADQMGEEQIAIMARKLMDSTPAVKSFADAEMFIAGFDDAVKALAKKPKKKIFVKIEDLTPSRGARKQKIERDFEGMPVKDGRTFSRTVPFGKSEIESADMTLLTSKGSQFTGRAPSRDKMNRSYESQLQKGPQQLAAVSNVMKAIDTIAGAITSKELTASPEQAQLLGRVLNELGVKMAPDATPQQIFKEFEKNASLKFEEVVSGIESAAKNEAVIAQAQRAFTMSLDENMAIMEAIQKTDPGELQRKVMQFTEDAIWQVDEACRANFGKSSSAPTEFLERMIRGE